MRFFDKKYLNELLFSIYLHLFPMLKVLTTGFPNFSTLILFVFTGGILIQSLIHNQMKVTKTFVYVTVFSFLVLFFDVLTRMNDQSIGYVYSYIIYGLITMFLYSYVQDKEKVIRYFAGLSVIVFLVLFSDPFNDYYMTDTYMVFGYSMLPAFSGMYVGWIYLKNRWFIPLVVISFAQLVIFANRGAILAASVVLVVLFLNRLRSQDLKFKINQKSIGIILSAFIGLILIIVNAYSIVNFFYRFFLDNGYFSYALFTLSRILRTGNLSFELFTRNVIQERAWEYIGKYLILGNGIGSFHDFYGIYTHNLILEILATFGVVGLIVFTYLITRSIRRIVMSSGYDRLFGLLIILLSIIPLWFSMNLFVSKEFWVLIMIGFDRQLFSVSSDVSSENGHDKVKKQFRLKKRIIRIYEMIMTVFDLIIMKVIRKHPAIMTFDETVAVIQAADKSMCRFGDGEFAIMNGHNIKFQKYSSVLSEKLRMIIGSDEKNLLICLPDIFFPNPLYTENTNRYWKKEIAKYRLVIYKSIIMSRTYGNAFVSRPYMIWKDKIHANHRFNALIACWKGKNILVIEGEKTRMGVENDLFSHCSSVRRILVPSENAFSKYDEILNSVLEVHSNELILISAGPTAKVLVYDLCLLGIQAMDIGHLDMEYEWFLRGTSEKVIIDGKYTSEVVGGDQVTDVNISEYTDQIVKRVL